MNSEEYFNEERVRKETIKNLKRRYLGEFWLSFLYFVGVSGNFIVLFATENLWAIPWILIYSIFFYFTYGHAMKLFERITIEEEQYEAFKWRERTAEARCSLEKNS